MSLIQITRQITHWIRECWRKVSSPLPSPTPPTHPQRLIKAVDNAQILLNFAIEDHRKIAPKIIDDLTTSISALNTGLASVPDQIVEGERAFWNAYEALSEAVAPVTAESVVHSRRQSHSFIRATPVPYAAIALVLFLGVVLLQWHSFEGTTLRKSLNDTETEVQKRIDEERKKSRDVRVANEQSKSKFTEIVRNGCSPDDEFPQPKNLKKLSVAQEAICQQLRKELADNRTTVRNLDDDKELLSQQLGRAQRIVDPRVELLDEWLVRFDHWLVCLNMISCFNKASVAENKGPGEIDKLKLMLDERQATIGALKATLETLRSERQNLFRANQPNSARYGSELEGKLDANSVQSRNFQLMLREQREVADNLREELNRKKESRIEQQKHRASQRIDLLEKYVLPILLGALGSVIYILRSVIGAIRQNTYTSHFISLSIVRVSLGTIAGLLGMLVFPKEMLFGKDVLPLAVPLLLGYAVEIFFTAMDRLVKAFSDSPK